MAKVTFTNNVDHYVKGDVVELSKEQLKDLDAYIKRWNIKDAYQVEGGRKSQQPKSEPKSDTTKAPKANASTKATGEGDTPDADKTDEAITAPEDKGGPATEGEGENPEPTDDSDANDDGTEGGEDSGDTTTDDKSNKK